MQKALPYRIWPPSTTTGPHESPPGHDDSLNSNGSDGTGATSARASNSNISVTKLVSENAVIAFGRSGCCMCHVVKQLLLGLGVNPTIFFVDEDDEAAIMDELSKFDGAVDGKLQFPAVFVGGKLFGGLERVMATHITGELVPMLREARALWL